MGSLLLLAAVTITASTPRPRENFSAVATGSSPAAKSTVSTPNSPAIASFSLQYDATQLTLQQTAAGDLGEHFDLAQTRVWAWSLLTFSPQVPAHGGFLLHAFFGLLLLMYIPFSKVMHFGGIFFTQTLVKRS